MKKLIFCVSVGGACCMFTCIMCRCICTYKCMCMYIYTIIAGPYMVDLCHMFCHSIVFSHWAS